MSALTRSLQISRYESDWFQLAANTTFTRNSTVAFDAENLAGYNIMVYFRARVDIVATSGLTIPAGTLIDPLATLEYRDDANQRQNLNFDFYYKDSTINLRTYAYAQVLDTFNGSFANFDAKFTVLKIG